MFSLWAFFTFDWFKGLRPLQNYYSFIKFCQVMVKQIKLNHSIYIDFVIWNIGIDLISTNIIKTMKFRLAVLYPSARLNPKSDSITDCQSILMQTILMFQIGLMVYKVQRVNIVDKSDHLYKIYMEDLITEAQFKYYAFTDYLYGELILYYPRFDNYNRFEKFIILNLIVIASYIILSIPYFSTLKNIYKKVVRLVFSLGPIRKEVAKNLEKARDQILADYPKQLLPTLDKIPYKDPKIKFDDISEKESLKGKLSGSRYAIESHGKFIANLSKLFSYSNPLHLEMFSMSKQMENEVIDMTAQAIGLKDEKGQPCGTCNSGGTESIIMAILAYREYKMKVDGVLKPNLVICKTGHVAALKACDYLGVQARIVSFNSNYEMNVSQMKSNIDQDTICVYTSYPNYPYGTCDPIQVIAPYCHSRGIPVHVDMCLGGFVSPFIEENWKIPKGVTSISADPHKYGLSAKGISVLLYSSDKYRKYQYFVTTYWPGGLYATPGVSGSRTGVYISSAWISMMKLGAKGYRENAIKLKKTVTEVSGELRKLNFKILGDPKVCIISFIHNEFSVNSVMKFMKKRGWGFSLLQKPLAIHFSFTPLNCLKKDEMIKDFKECIQFLKKNGANNQKETSQIQLYGACGSIPDVGTKTELMSTILDIFLDLN